MAAPDTHSATVAVQQMNLWWVMLAPVFPLLGFIALALLPRALRNKLRYIPIAGLAISFLIAVAAAIAIWPGGEINAPFYQLSWTLGHVGTIPLTLSLAVDSLAVLMLLMVSLVGLCVQVYSLRYMKDDQRIGWFFTVKSLFLAAMLTFVLSGGLLLQFAMWEIMGLCSYLLIGFWYRNSAPRKASQKAFLVTRAGDVGFFIALSAVFVGAHSFEFADIFAAAPDWSPFLLGVVVFGLIWAAIGKSAQFPLSAWLPDAMAGPTPGSALIHAATMVVAGVFMLVRMMPVIELSTLAMNVILAVGVITALYGALSACFQDDLKRVLAFSTISQLGFLFAVIGAGATFVAVFHLTTHAFFKALLFLAAGIIIHASGHQNMNCMGGLRKKMPVTFIVFTIGAFALAGLMPLSGFFSKDEIFKTMLDIGTSTGNWLPFVGVIAVGLMTAFYVTKTWCRVFFDKGGNVPTGDTRKLHEGHPLELAPVVALAVPAALAGLAVLPLGTFLAYHAHWPPLYMIAISTSVFLLGAATGYYAYRRAGFTGQREPSKNRAFVKSAGEQGFYLNTYLDYGIIKPYFFISTALWQLDVKVIDGAVNGSTWLYKWFSAAISWLDANVIDGIVNGIAWLYRFEAHLIKWFDDRIIDGIVNAITAVYVLLTRLSRIFDVRAIDGAVNGLGHLSVIIGGRLRTVQSGEVTWYQRLIVGAGIVIVGIFVVVYVALV